MWRKKKSVLNQVVKETVIKEEPIVATPEQIEGMEEEGVKEIAKLVDEKIQDDLQTLSEPKEEISLRKQEEISLKVSGEKLAEVLEEKKVEAVTDEEVKEPVVEGIVIIKPSKEQLAKLSKAGLRWYQRTGMLPK